MPWQPAFPVEPGELELALLYIAPESLRNFAHLVPRCAHAIIDAIGEGPALALFNALPGVEMSTPRHFTERGPGGRLCALLCDVIGVQATVALLAAFGGDKLEVPVCASLRVEQRKQWACDVFDELTGPRFGMTSARAVCELCAMCASVGAPVHHRSVEEWINSSSPTKRIGGWRATLHQRRP